MVARAAVSRDGIGIDAIRRRDESVEIIERRIFKTKILQFTPRVKELDLKDVVAKAKNNFDKISHGKTVRQRRGYPK